MAFFHKAETMPVLEKSAPLNSNGSSVILASAYAKQAPQLCGVPAPAEVVEGLACQVRLFDGDRLDHYADAAK